MRFSRFKINYDAKLQGIDNFKVISHEGYICFTKIVINLLISCIKEYLFFPTKYNCELNMNIY